MTQKWPFSLIKMTIFSEKSIFRKSLNSGFYTIWWDATVSKRAFRVFFERSKIPKNGRARPNFWNFWGPKIGNFPYKENFYKEKIHFCLKNFSLCFFKKLFQHHIVSFWWAFERVYFQKNLTMEKNFQAKKFFS